MIRLRGARTRAVGGDPAALRVTAHHDDCFDGRTRAALSPTNRRLGKSAGPNPAGLVLDFCSILNF
jgi:hypothetical protein